MAIPGPSGQEAAVLREITRTLRRAGAPASAIHTDNAHRRTAISGDVGNLILRLPGTFRGPRRLLMAHTDTVPLCVGSKPAVRGGWIRSADRRTGLGADDRSGVAVILNAALAILRRQLPHPPLTFLWTVQEEVGLEGARYARLGLLGRPRLAFNFDGGAAEKLTVGATGAYRLKIVIDGLASHAGGAPEQGVSAVAIAGLAVAQLQRQGWHGDIQKRGRHGTSNVGYIAGGGATNVVTDQVEVRAEARSHDPRFRRQIVEAFEQAFQKAARNVRSTNGSVGRVRLESRLDYESFVLPRREASILVAEAAVRSAGLDPQRAVTNGGIDANWMTHRGIPTVTLGCGQRNPHTVAERLDVAVFQSACRIALRLATGGE
jgi:tripeptide aminopeptidase